MSNNIRRKGYMPTICVGYSSDAIPVDLTEMFPSWRETWTPTEAESGLAPFVWKGPGWYLSNSDTLLVLPLNRTRDGEQLFYFLVYNSRNPGNVFNWIINAPTAEDTRS
jgi:hypothetical protein